MSPSPSSASGTSTSSSVCDRRPACRSAARCSSSTAGNCVFCAVVAGAPHDAIYRDADTVAFLDHAPVIKGHTLVVTAEHYPTIEDMPNEAFRSLFGTVKRVSVAMGPALGAEGSLVLTNTRISQSVPHVHVHVVPRRQGDKLFSPGRTFWMRQRYAEGEAAAIAEKLRAALGD